jgi:hypothetical protein
MQAEFKGFRVFSEGLLSVGTPTEITASHKQAKKERRDFGIKHVPFLAYFGK